MRLEFFAPRAVICDEIDNNLEGEEGRERRKENRGRRRGKGEKGKGGVVRLIQCAHFIIVYAFYSLSHWRGECRGEKEGTGRGEGEKKP